METLRRFTVGRLLFCYWIAIYPLIMPGSSTSLVFAAEEEIIESANEGQSAAAALLWNHETPTVNQGVSTGEESQYYNNFGTAEESVKNELWLHDFVPGYDPANPEAGREELETYADDTIGLYNNGVLAQGELAGGGDGSALAYQTISEGAGSANMQAIRTSDFINDPMFDNLPSIIDGTHPEWEGLTSGCVTENYETEIDDEEVIVGDTRACTQIAVPEVGACEITREVQLVPVETKVVFTISTRSGETNCGPNCGYNSMDLCKSDKLSCRNNCIDNWEAEGHSDVNACYAANGCAPQCSWFGTVYTCDFYYHCNLWCTVEIDGVVEDCSEGTPARLTGNYNEIQQSLGSPVPITTVEFVLGEEDVEVTRDWFDPPALDLLPEEYVIGNYQVTTVDGNGATIQLNDAGELSNNWTHDFILSLDSAIYVEVSATLYRYVYNEFSVDPDCDPVAANGLVDGYCTGTITCTDYSACRMVDIDTDNDGVADEQIEYCEEGPPHGFDNGLMGWGDTAGSELPQMCWAASANITTCEPDVTCSDGECSCDGLEGQEYDDCVAMSCWIDAEGNEQCVEAVENTWVNNLGDPGWVDSCDLLIANENCTRSTLEPPCNVSQIGEFTGECYARDIIFNCGTPVTIEHPPITDESLLCSGDIACLGTECHNITNEQNEGFGDAMVATSIIDASQSDIKCTDRADPSTCVFFAGTENYCKDPRGGRDLFPECCQQAQEAALPESDVALYLKLSTTMFSLMSQPMVAEWLATSAANSAYTVMADGVNMAATSVAQDLATSWNSVMQTIGFDSLTVDATEVTIDLFSTGAADAGWTGGAQLMGQFVYDLLPQALADEVFSSTVETGVSGWADTATGEVLQTVSNILGWIMFIYTIYKIAQIIFSMLDGFKCEEAELSFGNALVHGSCHYMGSKCARQTTSLFPTCIIDARIYCCYDSPLARILNEQIKGASVPPDQRSEYRGEEEWGTVEEPKCEGLTIEDLENADWSDIDLSEWQAIMIAAGIMPDPNEFDVPRPWQSRLGTAEDHTYDNSVESNAARIQEINQTIDDNYWELYDLGSSGVSQNAQGLMPWWENTRGTRGIPCDQDKDPDCG